MEFYDGNLIKEISVKSKKEYFYPVWLRTWHWLNALLFLLLIFTGVNMQYANIKSPLIEFHSAVTLHNVSGITLTLNYLFFIVVNFISGNYKQYIPTLQNFISNLVLQTNFYLHGIFKNEEHPFKISNNRKFNPLQQFTYLQIMYAAVPIMVMTGWALLFPEVLIKQMFGISGLTLTDIVHTIGAFFLSVFIIGHIYLATTGTTILINFKAMVTGWHFSPDEESEPHIYSTEEASNEK